MIPFVALAAMYATAAVAVAASRRLDFRWAAPTKHFLTHTLAAWAIYWLGVAFGWGDITIRHVLGRWLHVPLVAAVVMTAAALWYANREPK